MNLIKRLFYIVIAILVVGVGLLFSLENSTPVPLNLFFKNFTDQPLAVWVLSSFVFGGGLGLLLSFFTLMRLKGRLGLSERRANRFEKELAALKAAELRNTDKVKSA
ncbi:LapA family protein [bacterium]|nr:LapA family protein [bacterium]